MGRMGTMHAWESFGDGVPPDIQAVAKVSKPLRLSIRADLDSRVSVVDMLPLERS
jgi:hypothetical protein